AFSPRPPRGRGPAAVPRARAASRPAGAVATAVAGRLRVDLSRAPAGVDDPGRVPRPGRRVHPGEVEVVAAPVAWVAVPSHPAPGRDGGVLLRLGQVG